MLRVLEGALRHRAASNNPNLQPVIKAFESLERYILLLVDQPWKPEYKKLKVSIYIMLDCIVINLISYYIHV